MKRDRVIQLVAVGLALMFFGASSLFAASVVGISVGK